MKTFTAIATAAVLALTAVASTGTAQAGSKHKEALILGAFGLATGVVIGSAIAAQPRHTRVVVTPANAHYRWCASKYRSYEAETNTWIDRYGNIRNCNSPYGG